MRSYYWLLHWSGVIKRAKLQSNRRNQLTTTRYFTGRIPFLSPNQQRQSTAGKSITFYGINHHKLTRKSSSLVVDH